MPDAAPNELAPQHKSAARLELSVVIPTYNERGSVLELVGKLHHALTGLTWEAIFVDDHSADGTAGLLREVALQDSRIRVIERIGRRGLSSACIEGMMSSAAPYLAVMDADLQHDETLLPAMLQRLRGEDGGQGCDVVIASRNMTGGGMGDFAPAREQLSHLGRRVSRLVCRCDITDAMSGFFMVDAAFVRPLVPRLSGSGFKILVDILATSPQPPRVEELPYVFRTRQAGESKLDASVQLEFLFLILDKLVGRWIPTRFALFLCVGLLGLAVHLSVLAVLYGRGLLAFTEAQIAATFVAMTSNFLLNNVATFRDQRLRGVRLATGLLKFYAACSVGALANVSFASLMVRRGLPWFVAGAGGTAISSVWNYGVNTVLTWRRGAVQ